MGDVRVDAVEYDAEAAEVVRRVALVRYWSVVGGLALAFGSVALGAACAAALPRTESLCTYNIEGMAHGQVGTNCKHAPFCSDYCQQEIIDNEKRCEAAMNDTVPYYEEGCWD